MKIQMQNIVNGNGALDRLMANSFPVKISYRLSRVLTGVQQELKHFADERMKLFKRLGKETDGIWQIEAHNLDAFNEEIQDLMELEVSIWGDKMKLEDLGNINISPADLSAIHWLFEQEEEATEASEETQSVTA